MRAYARIMEKAGDALCWIAIGLAVYWIAFKDDAFSTYVAATFFAGLTLGVSGYFLREYRLNTGNRKSDFWRGVARALVVVFIGGAGLSLLIYFMALHDVQAEESFRQTVLALAGAKLALGAVAFLSLRFIR